MPGMYKPGEYDLAGFCVGVVDRSRIIDGSAIRPGDVVIGLASSGIHSNGYSLVRSVLSKIEIKRMSAQLLKPTRIYVKPVLSIIEKFNLAKPLVTGISHITGGAFYDKISRILPADIDVVIRKSSWEVPDIFKLIQLKGNISDAEMYHTLNMGVGMVLVVRPQACDSVLADLGQMKVKSWVIGEAVGGSKKVLIV